MTNTDKINQTIEKLETMMNEPPEITTAEEQLRITKSSQFKWNKAVCDVTTVINTTISEQALEGYIFAKVEFNQSIPVDIYVNKIGKPLLDAGYSIMKIMTDDDQLMVNGVMLNWDQPE